MNDDPFQMDDATRWYCVKTRPRQERSARLWLTTEAGLEVFCPLLQFERPKPMGGKMRVTEAMFPGYLFVRFDYEREHRRVRTTAGVAAIVSFGGEPAVVAPEIVNELRAAVRSEDTIEIPSVLTPGEEVHVVEGPFRGVRAVVTRVLPARQRVHILLELLGLEREIEISTGSVLPEAGHPLRGKAR